MMDKDFELKSMNLVRSLLWPKSINTTMTMTKLNMHISMCQVFQSENKNKYKYYNVLIEKSLIIQDKLKVMHLYYRLRKEVIE